MPSTEEKQGGDAAHGDHVHVFGHKKHGEFHGAVLGVIPGHEFGFSLRQVKGYAIGLSKRRHQVNKERNELRKYVPVGKMGVEAQNVPRLALRVHNLAQAETSRQNQYTNKGES